MSKSCCKVCFWPRVLLPVFVVLGLCSLFIASYEPIPREHFVHAFRDNFMFGVVKSDAKPTEPESSKVEDVNGLYYYINSQASACNNANYAGKIAGIMTTMLLSASMFVGALMYSIATWEKRDTQST